MTHLRQHAVRIAAPAAADPVERARKTGLMQRANVAYAANDLLGLLELQLSVEQIDQAGLDGLGEDRIKQYNKILAGQVDNVKAELDAMEFGFTMEMGWEFYQRPTLKRMLTTLRDDITRAKAQVATIEADLETLGDIKKLKAWLKKYRIAPPEPDIDIDIDDFYLQTRSGGSAASTSKPGCKARMRHSVKYPPASL